jgi:hypothetical protein
VNELNFPALYNDADLASNRAQNEFLIWVKAEYILLVLAAIFTIEPFYEPPYPILYALIFLASLFVMFLRTLRKPDQDWYKCRALAESIKTTTWRYATCAHPFDDASTEDARGDFRRFLRAIFKANQHIGPRIAGLTPEGDQITRDMDERRCRSLEERKELYLKERIRDQRSWYASKAKTNKHSLRIWIFICSVVYIAAAISVLFRVQYPHAPTEPLIVIASSLVGWTQIKKYSELASSYALAAHEIGIIEGRITDIRTNSDFSDFVNEAELAFSREHTQWVARQHEI